MQTKNFFILFILIFDVVHTLGKDKSFNIQDYGLKFKAHEYIQEERTSFQLKEIAFGDYLEFGYDFAFYGREFGYLSRILFSNSDKIDIVSKIYKGEIYVQVLFSDSILITESVKYSNDRYFWNNIKLKVNLKESLLKISLNKREITINNYIFKDKSRSANFYFGANNNVLFTNNDVPPIILKDFYVKNSKDKYKYKWRFDKHLDDSTYDEVSNNELKIDNPIWIIDGNTRWMHLLKKTYKCRTHFVYNDNKIFSINSNSITSINLNSLDEFDFKFDNKINFGELTNQFIYDNEKDVIYFFNIDKWGKTCFSEFDFSSGKWSMDIDINSLPSNMQSNLYVSEKYNKILHLFGYGHYTYHSEILVLSKDSLKKYRVINQKIITPRYLSALGTYNDSILYVYGGIGNYSGKQEMGMTIYNDMYSFNLKSDEIMKLWDLDKSKSKNEIMSKSMFFVDDKTAIALFFSPSKYRTSLKLKSIDIETGQMKSLADSIPYLFLDTSSEADLFFSKTNNKLYAYTSHKTETGATELNIYSIQYPILTYDEATCKIENDNILSNKMLYIFLILIISYLLYIYLQKHKKIDNVTQEYSSDKNGTSEKIVNVEKFECPSKKTGIYLLGGFQIIDKNNNDITGDFSPLMKQLLSLIILYTQKDNRGISNAKLKDYLWFDKTEESARNNRSVNIRKIRVLLENVGDVLIVSNNSYWRIEINDNTFCDYIYVSQFVNSINKNFTNEELEKIVESSFFGELLPNQNNDFFDVFKSEYTNTMIDKLNLLLDNVQDLHKKERIVDCILIFDSTDENAVKIKCKCLVENGHIGMAKVIYNNFIRDYNNLLGVEYNLSFESFISI